METVNRFDVIERNIYQKQLKEYEATKRLKAEERKFLREWVADYNSVYSNPFYIYDDDGKPMDYISAYRRCVKEHKIELRKELKEYEMSISDLTDKERKDLHDWVSDGNSVYDNPYHAVKCSGCPVDYIEAIRTFEEMRDAHDKSYVHTDENITF
jgi:hypothetical protein